MNNPSQDDLAAACRAIKFRVGGVLATECDGHSIAQHPHGPPAGAPAPSIKHGDGREPHLDLHGAPVPALERGGLVGPDVGPVDVEAEGERGCVPGPLREGREGSDGDGGGGGEVDVGDEGGVGDGELGVGVVGEEGGVEGRGEGGVGRGIGDAGEGE